MPKANARQRIGSSPDSMFAPAGEEDARFRARECRRVRARACANNERKKANVNDNSGRR